MNRDGYLICACVPPLVALVMAQAASLRVLNSAWRRMSMSAGKMSASMTAWIWCALPAVMLDSVQQASLRSGSAAWRSSASSAGSGAQLSTACVCASSPVTTLPTARSAADTTVLLLCLRQR